MKEYVDSKQLTENIKIFETGYLIKTSRYLSMGKYDMISCAIKLK